MSGLGCAIGMGRALRLRPSISCYVAIQVAIQVYTLRWLVPSGSIKFEKEISDLFSGLPYHSDLPGYGSRARLDKVYIATKGILSAGW